MKYFKAVFKGFVATWGASSGPNAPYDVSGPLNTIWAQSETREAVVKNFTHRFGDQSFKLKEFTEAGFRKAAKDGVILICV